jgi:O-antigen/teichoic acid export membrane protein
MERVRRLWGTNSTVTVLFSLFFFSLVLVFGKPLFGYFVKGVDFYPFIVLGIFTVFPLPLVAIFQNSLRTQQKALNYAKFGFFMQVLTIFFIVFFLTVLKLKIEGIFIALIIVNSISFVYVCWVFGKKIRWGFDLEILRKSFRYSVQLIPHNLSGSIAAMLDKVLLGNFRSTGAVGIYSVGLSFGLVLNLITAGFNESYTPYFMKKMKEKEGTAEIVRVGSYAFFVFVCAGMGISIFAKDVIGLLTTREYLLAWTIVPFVVVSNLLEGLYRILVAPLFYHIGGPKYISMISMALAAFNIGALYILIPKFGMYGGVLALILTNLIRVICIGIAARYMQKIQWEYRKFAVLFSSGIILSSSLIWLNEFYIREYQFLLKSVLYLGTVYFLLIISGYNLKKVVRFARTFLTISRVAR